MASLNVPAVCNDCDIMFASAIPLGLFSDTQLTDHSSACPCCNQPAPVLDEIRDILKRGIRLFQGDCATMEMLTALNIAVENIRGGEKPPEQIILGLGAVSPPLAKEFTEWADLGTPVVDAMADVAVAVSMWAPGADDSQTVAKAAVDAFEDLYHEAAAEPKVANI